MQDTSSYVELAKDSMMPEDVIITSTTPTKQMNCLCSSSSSSCGACGGTSVLHKNDKQLLQMLVLFASIILFGGFIFSRIEQPNELLRLSNVRTDQAAAKTRTLALLNNNHTLFDLDQTHSIF